MVNTGRSQGVYYIPKLNANLISLGQLDENGCDVCIFHGVRTIRDAVWQLLAHVRRTRNRLYLIKITVARSVCLSARTQEAAWLWHARFGHLHFDALRQLARQDMVRGLPPIDQVEQLCDCCVVSKQRRSLFPGRSLFRVEDRLELIHGDLCGPISPATPGGKKHFLLLVDDASRYMWLTLLQNKGEAAAAIKRFQARSEAESGFCLKLLRTDNGGEFTSAEFAAHCTESGVKRQLTAPYSPQQNGVVERRNQTILSMVQSLLKAKSVPVCYWGEAVTMAVFLLNRAPTKCHDNKTLYEAWFGRKPAVGHLRTFGCLAYVKDVRPHITKLLDRGKPMVFLGYVDGSKAYKVFDPKSGRVHVSRDVVFDEGAGWDWDATAGMMSPPPPSDFTVEYVVTQEPAREESPAPTTTAASPGHGAAMPGATPPTPSPTSLLNAGSPCFVSPPQDGDDNLDADANDCPPRYRSIDGILGEAYTPGLAARDLADGELYLLAAEEPATFGEAEHHQEWRHAMLEEISSIEDNKTWRLVDLPPGHRANGLKWVYKIKKDAGGMITKHKARLVAKGYAQQPGVDFDEVFAPVARLESVRMLLTRAAQAGWPVHHMDVKSAFLNGELTEEVYVKQPPRFVVDGREHQVLHLDKALYGVRQAPRAWNTKLDASML
jgi:hypothetical protein